LQIDVIATFVFDVKDCVGVLLVKSEMSTQ
jgi:hypothetical protein